MANSLAQRIASLDCNLLQQLREGFYPELAKAANRWLELLSRDAVYPAALSEFLGQCHQQGQLRPTPLILRYENGGYNCLHQDLYGEVSFPFQVVFLLNQKERDYTGGEFLLVEQRPRVLQNHAAPRSGHDYVRNKVQYRYHFS